MTRHSRRGLSAGAVMAVLGFAIIFAGCKDSTKAVLPDMVLVCQSHDGIQTMAIDGYGGPEDSGVVCKDQTAFYYADGRLVPVSP